jgi:N-acetylmuramoyl-L-alanine amidase
MNRKSTEAIVLHCTATLEGQPYNAVAIREMHQRRGFSDIGYHFLIGIEGEEWQGRKPLQAVGAHVRGFNDRTLGVSYVGGLRASDAKPVDTRTPKQIKTMIDLLKRLMKVYPNAIILGHRDLSPDLDGDGIIEPFEFIKICPCFDAGPWAKSVGLPGGRYRNGAFEKL